MDSGLFQARPRETVLRDLMSRVRKGLDGLDDPALLATLEDALYCERKRLERQTPKEHELERLDRLTDALVKGSRRARLDAGMSLVEGWGEEIHGRFDPRLYRFATKALPRALTGLLSAKPDHLRDWDLSPSRRLKVTGPLTQLQQLAKEATLILAPTHLSNLDSPLMGLALYQAGLPPFVYGAGLNLFENSVLGFFMRRLGAYTVDRLKRASLYKEVLKNYSVMCLTTRHHSLFFPGGTRSRSGAIETRVKKGLLGTGLTAWQEMIAAGRKDPEVYVIPLTLSCQLVLEAATLIEDHLAEAGKQRFIISDDEFAQPRRLATFGRRVLDLDSSVVAHFGAPLDVLGRPVSLDPDERREQALRRRGYVCDVNGQVQWDEQRDRLYTDRLAEALVAAWPKGAHVMATHLVAWVGWRSLELAAGQRDPFRLIRIPTPLRRIPETLFRERLARALEAVNAGAAAGRWHTDLPSAASDILAQALDRFGRYHRSRALARQGSDLVVEDPKLCLYYRNRLLFAAPEV